MNQWFLPASPKPRLQIAKRPSMSSLEQQTLPTRGRKEVVGEPGQKGVARRVSNPKIPEGGRPAKHSYWPADPQTRTGKIIFSIHTLTLTSIPERAKMLRLVIAARSIVSAAIRGIYSLPMTKATSLQPQW